MKDAANFDDLLTMRKGDENMTEGGGATRIEPIATPEEWAVKAEALRELFRQTLGMMPDVACPLSPEVVGETDCGDHVRREATYLVEPDERISAYALVPKGLKGRAPGVLCIHQTTPHGKEQVIGNDPTEEGRRLAYALHLVRRGYVTLAYDLMSAGARRFRGLEHFDTAPFYEKHPHWSARGKDLWDARRAVDFLRTLPEVDPERIGSIGHSQGGGITIHAMALDDRIKAGVSSCGLCPMRMSKNPFNEARTAWWVGRPFLRPYCRAGKLWPIDLHEYLALAAPRAIMHIAALNDFKYDLEEAAVPRAAFANLEKNVKRVFALLGAEGNFRNVLHTRGHGFLREQRELAYAFLDEKLMGVDGGKQ